jgi:predicted nucleic acid-binding protein
VKLADITTGATVFVDAGIFVYHFTGASNECSDFLERCEKGEIAAVTGINVILDVLRSLMMVEAVKKNLVSPPNVAEKLCRAPRILKQLNEYFINTESIREMGITIKPLEYDTLENSHVSRLASGLMINESIILAGMKKDRIKLLATGNRSFKQLGEIQACTPSDI